MSDIVDGLIKMMASDEKGPINLGNPYQEFKIKDLVSLFEEITFKQLKISYLDATGDDPRQRKPDITLATKLLGWEPKVGIKEGLKLTYDFFNCEVSNADRK